MTTLANTARDKRRRFEGTEKLFDENGPEVNGISILFFIFVCDKKNTHTHKERVEKHQDTPVPLGRVGS